MNVPARFLACITFAVLCVAACSGGHSVADELKVVPGLCFLHAHISEEMDVSLIPGSAGDLFPVWLVDSLHARGGFGVSLLGVNLTDLSPQLLFLSRRVDAREMAAIAGSGFGGRIRETETGYDLVDSRGSILGSVAERDGWACLVTGSGADRSASRWLSMDASQSLAADSDLVSISQSEADLTVLASRNSIGFLSVIPTGMLTRQQNSYLNFARNFIADLGLRAAGLYMDVTDDRPGRLTVELRMVREGGYITSLSAGFSDTGIPPDSAIAYLAEFYGLE
ncbi:MAG: hypothetical protein AVO35_00155 [Candidatus Aegiribacteria sp. MLS_C]|nr:MAG: hypothetical protein AVO35_00155 [Candidatus Aegiribacteria sp. MLS_C]